MDGATCTRQARLCRSDKYWGQVSVYGWRRGGDLGEGRQAGGRFRDSPCPLISRKMGHGLEKSEGEYCRYHRGLGLSM